MKLKYFTFIPLILLFFIISNFGFSQSKNTPLIFRQNIEKKKSLRKLNSGQEVKTDTTIIIKNVQDLDFSQNFSFLNDKDVFDDYINAVFSKKNAVIQQFIVPIVIYLDPKIPTNIVVNYTEFVNKIPKIKNLDISFTDDIDKANYLLKVSERDFNGISKKTLEKFDKKDQNKMIFLKMKSTHFNDENKNCFAYLLVISPKILTEESTLTKLKKAFFQSLGNFSILSYGAPKGSTLDFGTTEIDQLIEEDIQVLKMHYHNIYDYKINAKNFYKLYYSNKKQ